MRSQRTGYRSQTDRKDRRGNSPDHDRPVTPAGEALYGRHAVLESLDARRREFHKLWIALGTKPDTTLSRIGGAARARGVPIEHVDRRVLDQATVGANHQGVTLFASSYPYIPLADIAIESGLVLVLDHFQDPQNVGTLLRTAEAAKVDGVLMPRDRAAAITPSVVSASAGAAEYLNVAQVTNVTQSLQELQKRGWWVVALDQGEDAQPFYQTELPTPVALVIGAEGEGVSNRVRQHADVIVSLPMLGQVGSLNASTAGSIALFDLIRRRG